MDPRNGMDGKKSDGWKDQARDKSVSTEVSSIHTSNDCVSTLEGVIVDKM